MQYTNIAHEGITFPLNGGGRDTDGNLSSLKLFFLA